MESYEYEELANGASTEVGDGEQMEDLTPFVHFTYTTDQGLREVLKEGDKLVALG